MFRLFGKKYPERAIDDQDEPQKLFRKNATMECVYAGPAQMMGKEEPVPMAPVYAGPVQMEESHRNGNPMGRVYAGPERKGGIEKV